jgi:dolichol-phosphate mannosyltransferase
LVLLTNYNNELKDDLKESKIAIVMPVYNEGDTILKTVDELNAKFLHILPNSKLFIFEDGSKDNTKEILKIIQTKYNQVEALMSNERKGYPAAAKNAIMSILPENFEYVLFCDSDGQYDPQDFWKLLNAISLTPVDEVVGGRINRAEPTYRVILSKGLRVIEKILFHPKEQDVTSALRLIRTEMAQNVASRVNNSAYNFWTEFTAISNSMDYKIVEIPVDYREREGESRVYSPRKMPKVILNEFVGLLKTWSKYSKKRLLKFMVVGALGALIILGVTYGLTQIIGINYLISTAIAIEVSIIFAFLLNNYWSFAKVANSIGTFQRMVRYNIISLIGLSLNELILFSLTGFFHIYYIMSELFSIIIVFLFNYMLNVRYTWFNVNAK